MFVFQLSLATQSYNERTESPINSCPSVRPSVRPLVTHFSQNWFIFFSDILHEVRVHKGSKVTEPNLLGNFSFAQIWGKRAQKWTFYTFSQNSFISFFRYCA